jgi:RNA polymerase sigma factor (sigma-70 family)
MQAASNPTFDAILLKVRDRIFRYAASWLSKENAEDMTQEAVIVLMTKYRHLTDEEELFATGIKTFKWKKWGFFRKSERRGDNKLQQVDSLPLPAAGDDPEMSLLRKTAAKQMAQAIANMDENCRKVLYYWMNKTGAAETARRMGLDSENAVNLRVKRCKAKLKENVRREWLESI